MDNRSEEVQAGAEPDPGRGASVPARGWAGLAKPGGVTLAATILVGVIFHSLTSAYVMDHAEKSIENLLLTQKGMHEYVQEVMHPALYEYKREGELAPDFYAPELFSSSFIVRNMHVFFNRARRAQGLPELYYKMAAVNPRNPVNRADQQEKELIRMFNRDRELKKYREIVIIEDQKYLHYAIPFLENNRACLRCHGRREDAPRQLQAIYPGQGGFNEKVGEIRAIISVRAPLAREFALPVIISGGFMGGIGTILLLFFFSNHLKATIRNRTAALEREVAERRQMAAALHESEQQLRTLMDSTAEAIYGLDLEGNCTFVNPACLQMLGYRAPADLLGRNLHDLIHHSQADGRPISREKCLIYQAFREGEGTHGDDEVFWRSDGTCFPVEYRSYPVFRDHRIIGSVVTFLDITSRKALEEQLRHSQKMEAIGTMAGGIAHDFNNILTAVIGYTALARKILPPEHPAGVELIEVLKAGERAKNLVHQILTFSRKAGETRQPVEIRLLVKEALKLMRATIPSSITIRQQINADSGMVLADPTQIHQVLINLCANAGQAMEETGGELLVALDQVILKEEELPREGNCLPGDYVRLQVRDTGVGIEPAIRSRIYEPFFTTKAMGKGSGMGLAVVHGIVERHHGFVTVESEPGRGTTFAVYFPRVEGNLPELEEKSGVPPAGSERILLVDDEESLVRLGKASLERFGYQVRVFTDSTEALRAFRADPAAFDLLITDQTMPHLSGIELAGQVLAIRPDFPIILATGYSSKVDAGKAKEAGISRFISKPFPPGDLARAIRQVLAPAELPGRLREAP